MKLKSLNTLCAVAIVCVAVSCKTTEANYRAAYERAIEGKNANDTDSVGITPIRQEVKTIMKNIDGADLPTISRFVNITENGGGINESIKRYCVVSGQFKQVFNARSMRERLVENGYPGAFVVQADDRYFLVVAGSFHDAKQARELYDKLKADDALKLKSPMPLVLLPSQIR